ncbi:Heat shock factor-binding protein [Glycine soja]|uniref:Heat shock factor-binding protein n=1 Tax=Glycine soja TaxID=3848 RepID=A0A445LF28_GLYSO|nr:Heat shock factor-binding protein [Glycine soja]
MDGHDSEDPKQSTADMTAFVQNLLQQMNFVSSNLGSRQCLTPSFLRISFLDTLQVDIDGQRCQFYYIIIGSNCSSNVFLDIVIALDEMGDRINELEQSINDLRSEMGVESTPSPVAPAKPKEEESNKEEGSA